MRALLLCVAIASCAFSFAQGMGPIPVDPEVRIGKLPNGLTYYIRHNEFPKGQADFYIAQKVGSILENEEQRGLAHFLEHMCFNGTENFPGNSLIEWCESVGIKFGQNLNAYTSIDQTVYNISNVPVDRTGVQDSCLMILHDWADGLLLDPQEIDKERGVIHQEWRRSMVGQMRVLEKLLPEIYPGNRYGERLPIGLMSVVDNFDPQVLRDYYEKWYRPDQQGVIVVGDIDVDYIEGKIKEMFSPIKMPENPADRVYYPVDDTPGTIYAIGSDPELDSGSVYMMIKHDAVPDAMKADKQYLVMNYMLGMVTSMLNQRLSEIARTADAPFSSAGVADGDFFIAKTKDALSLDVTGKDNNVIPGFEAAYRELLRAARGGFTVGEYERVRSEYLSRLDKSYNGRDKRQSASFVKEYVDNFLDNEPIPSFEDEYQFMTQVANMIPVDALNQLLPQLIKSDNRVILAMVPDNGTYALPTEQEFESVIAKVDAEEIQPYVDQMKTEPLIPQLPTPGKVVSVNDLPQWGAKELTLSNGVKVVVKTTEYKKDEILFNATAMGGLSVIGDDRCADMTGMSLVSAQHGLGDYNNIDLQKYLQGKQASVGVGFDDYMRTLSGSSSVKDLPTMMELIYMTFVAYSVTPEEFATTQSRTINALETQQNTPDFYFSTKLREVLYSSKASQQTVPEDVRNASMEGGLNLIHSLLANAADYTFYFVGDVTVEQLTPLLEQYIATLPADASSITKEYIINEAREPKAGKGMDTFTYKMQTPQTTCLILVEGSMPYTAKNKVVSSMVGQILSNRLLAKIREEMGAVYSISAGSSMSRVGKYNTMIQIPFPMKPEMKEEVLKEIDKLMKDMSVRVTDDELNPIKEYMAKTAVTSKELNSSWLSAMSSTAINGVDVFNGNLELINSVTCADVEKFMKELLDQGNERTIILDPAE